MLPANVEGKKQLMPVRQTKNKRIANNSRLLCTLYSCLKANSPTNISMVQTKTAHDISPPCSHIGM